MKFISFEQSDTGLRLLAKVNSVSVNVLISEDENGRAMVYVSTDGPDALDTAIFGDPLMVLVNGSVVVNKS